MMYVSWAVASFLGSFIGGMVAYFLIGHNTDRPRNRNRSADALLLWKVDTTEADSRRPGVRH